MAAEFDHRPSQALQRDLLSPSTVEKLMEDGRTPFLWKTKGQKQTYKALCSIPANDSSPEEKFEVSFEEARKIATIIKEKLQKNLH